MKKLLQEILQFNMRTGKPMNAWKIVAEFCYTEKPEDGKRLLEYCEKNGKKDMSQSPEEIGAVGQAYIVDGNKVIAHFGFKTHEVC